MARFHCQEERGGAMAMKEREREADSRLRALQMVLSGDKESYLVVADAPEPGSHIATFDNHSVCCHSADFLIGK